MKHKFSLMWRVAVALVLVLSFSLVAAVPAMAYPMTDVTVTPEDATPAATTTYTIGFSMASDTVVGSVEMDFDDAFDVETGATLGTVTNIGAGTLTTAATDKAIYTVTTPAAVIPAGTAVTITLSGIVNPSSEADYTVTVEIKDTDGAQIDIDTASVTITDAPAEVWVDDGFTSATEGWEVTHWNTISLGISNVAPGGTVNVAAGNYTQAVLIDEELTLKGANYGVNAVTGDRGAESIIDGSSLTGAGPIGSNPATVSITAGNVILDGFTIVEPGQADAYGLLSQVTSAVPAGEVRNNIIYGGANYAICTLPGGSHTSWVISNNRLSSADGGVAVYLDRGKGAQITGNLITTGGIALVMTVANTTIENNTISNGSSSDAIGVRMAGDADGVTITGNTFSGNNDAGVQIFTGATKVLTYAIHQNNFVFSTTYNNGVINQTSTLVDASNNWWGDETGPTYGPNPGGKGEPITGPVDYTPWLLAPYGEEVTPVTTIDLVAGWNLVSLPLIPTSSAITDVLADVSSSVTIVQYYSAEAEGWLYYDPDVAESTLSTMKDGLGYWIKMSAAATLEVFGTEMPAAPELPHTYSVVLGWNLVGFKSVANVLHSTYLLNLTEEATGTGYSVLYGYDAVEEGYFSVYPILEHSGNMEPGCGYWLWATADGTIVPPR